MPDIDLIDEDSAYIYHYRCKCSYGAVAPFNILMDAIDALRYCETKHRKECKRHGQEAYIVIAGTKDVVFSW